MTLRLCTLFDVNYLTRGLALHRSLVDLGVPFHLTVFAMDDDAARILSALRLPDVHVVELAELERHDPSLAATRHDRTQVEYCWTATPAACLYVLETVPGASEVTYVDADVCFFSDPSVLLAEMADASVTIVPHRYAPEHAGMEATSGTYNVEWLTFRRDERGLAALRWWHDRCIEWCYFRHEDGKLGDQKYLDDWPERFEGVHVLSHPGGGLAPWNVTNHVLAPGRDAPLVDGRPLVFYHHHSLRLYRRSPASLLAVRLGLLRHGEGPLRRPWTSNYPVGDDERALVWRVYLRRLDDASAEACRIEPSFRDDALDFPVRPALERVARGAARRLVRRGRRLAGRLDPSRRLPGAFRRHVRSWHSEHVAPQMLELTERELAAPESGAPYRAFRSLLQALLADPDLPSAASLTDVGCGVGAYGELLRRWAPGVFRYVGVEESPPILEAARRRWPDREFRRGTLFDPHVLDGADVVLASALVDVLPDWREALVALLQADARWVVLHRQRVTEGPSRVDITGGYRRQRTYCTRINRDELDRLVADAGRVVTAHVVVDDDIESFVLKRVHA